MSIIHVWTQRRPARKISMSLLCLYRLLMFALSAIMSPHELPLPRIYCGFSALLRAVLVRAGARGRAEPLVACRQLYPGGDLQPAVRAGAVAVFGLHLPCRAQHSVLPQQKAAQNRHRTCHRSSLPDEIPRFFPSASLITPSTPLRISSPLTACKSSSKNRSASAFFSLSSRRSLPGPSAARG